MTAELALDRDGRFLAVRVTGHGNVGAYLGTVAPHDFLIQSTEAINIPVRFCGRGCD